MTTNVFDDNLTLWAAIMNALANADAGEAIISGCAISKGTGDWDIDVTSGTIIQGNTEASISSGTVTITDASGLTSGQSRVTIITTDTGDALASTDGASASNPTTPDIPAGEVLLGFVVVNEGDSTVADSDIFDVPALLGDDAVRYEFGGSHALDPGALPLTQESFGDTIYRVLDDFADNKTDSRDAPSTTASEFARGTVAHDFRPDWSAKNGSISASGSALQLADGSSTINWGQHHLSDMMPREFECAFQFSSTPSSNAAVVTWGTTTTNSTLRYHNGYRVQIDNDGTLRFQEVDNAGSTTTLISGTWGNDADEHTLRVVKDVRTWELLLDAASQGTADDENHQNAIVIGAANQTAQTLSIDDWMVA